MLVTGSGRISSSAKRANASIREGIMSSVELAMATASRFAAASNFCCVSVRDASNESRC